MDTYRVINHSGVGYGQNQPSRYRWDGGEPPAFNKTGIHKLKVSGAFTKKGESENQVPFETNEDSYEVSSKFASMADLTEKARDHLAKELGREVNQVQRKVYEEQDGSKMVWIFVGKKFYSEQEFLAGKLNDKKHHSGEYVGGIFTCRFTAEGDYINCVFQPRYGMY